MKRSYLFWLITPVYKNSVNEGNCSFLTQFWAMNLEMTSIFFHRISNTGLNTITWKSQFSFVPWTEKRLAKLQVMMCLDLEQRLWFRGPLFAVQGSLFHNFPLFTFQLRLFLKCIPVVCFIGKNVPKKM